MSANSQQTKVQPRVSLRAGPDVTDRHSSKSGSIVDSVVSGIKQRIRDGRFAPGQRLIETDLQAIFEVSRGPIREAIRRLSADGVVDVKHNFGAMVRALSRADLSNVFRIREVLEGLAARLAAENVGAGTDIAALLQLEQQFEKRFDGTAAKYIAYNDAFHQMIVHLSRNDHLIEILDRVQVRVYRVQAESLNSSAAFKRSRSEHKAIVAALVKGDGEKAEALMRRHIRHRLPEILADTREFFA
jgi:DNA-binding GntR family transcriptional regulator